MNRSVRKVDTRVKVAILAALSGAAITTLMTQALVPTLKGIIFRRTKPEPPEVTITSPAKGSEMLREVMVQGTAYHIPKDKELWILVAAGGYYFPQPGPIGVASDGTWITTTWVGMPEQVGMEFGLIAAIANKAGSAAIRANLAPKTFLPLDNLAGIEFMCHVRVTRK